MDETYIKVRGTWVYLYRAVDKQGFTVDFYLSPKRDVEAAKQFLRKSHEEPTCADENHTGCLCGIASGCGGVEEKWRTAQARVCTRTSKF